MKSVLYKTEDGREWHFIIDGKSYKFKNGFYRGKPADAELFAKIGVPKILDDRGNPVTTKREAIAKKEATDANKDHPRRRAARLRN